MPIALEIDGESLTLDALRAWEADPGPVTISPAARERLERNRAEVDEVVRSGEPTYGINTGFGALANQSIAAGRVAELQLNLVRSHTTGIGAPLSEGLTRRILLLKANSLAAGYSGVRPVVVETLLALLPNVLPVIPERGSVGASGDLAPLAHLALALIGEGEAVVDGRTVEGAAALQAAGTAPLQLEAKEGLALLNGTQLSAALAIDGLFRAERLLSHSILSGALSVEAMNGSFRPFDARIHEVRRLPGQSEVARRFRTLLTASEINDSHQECDRVQDPYSLRCMPQVLGAVQDTLTRAREVLAWDLNSVSDNPLVFEGDIVSGGNFHAEPLGLQSDFMAIAVSEIGAMAERRTDLLLRRLNTHLSMFLAGSPGVESGMMMLQVTAAALASENKTLAHPATADSMPTSAGQEDHVSMAPWAGHKLIRICDNVAYILAIELLIATTALEQQRPLRSTAPLESAVARLREHVPTVAGDHRHDRDVALVRALIEQDVLTSGIV